MSDESNSESFIRETLRRLSNQRVAMILQPGNVWVIEKAVESENEDVAAALHTCHIRGWVEVLYDAIPSGRLTPDGKLPEGNIISGTAPVYKLTEAGWNVIHRSHEWVVVTFVVVSFTLIATIIGIIITVTLIK